MSTASEYFEKLQAALDEAATHSQRLYRLLAEPWDELGKPTFFALPHARALLSADLRNAADAAELLGDELGDIRWTAVVALLHRGSTCVSEATPWDMSQLTGLLDRLKTRVVQLRNARSSSQPRVSLS
jgi:hypothetical protein